MPCEDAPCCGCCGPEADWISDETAAEMEELGFFEHYSDAPVGEMPPNTGVDLLDMEFEDRISGDY